MSSGKHMCMGVFEAQLWGVGWHKIRHGSYVRTRVGLMGRSTGLVMAFCCPNS